MSAAHRTPDYLQHILQALGRIRRYATGLDFDGFARSELVQDAVIRNLEIVGEACNRIVREDPAFAQAHADVPWRFAVGMRNVLSHGYFVVDLAVVWRTVEHDVPALERQVRTLLLRTP